MTENSMLDTVAVKGMKGGQFLTFILDAEVYGIEILRVQEIIGIMRVTHVPKTPEYVRGVINLRGKIIPILDLRLKFGMPEKEDSDRTCVIVVQIGSDSNHLITGIVVDEVSEVLGIGAEHMESPPSFGDNVDTHFILGMAKVGEKVVMLLDIRHVITGDEEAIRALMASGRAGD